MMVTNQTKSIILRPKLGDPFHPHYFILTSCCRISLITRCMQNGEFVSRASVGLGMLSKDPTSTWRKFNAHSIQWNDTNGWSMVRNVMGLSRPTDIAQIEIKQESTTDGEVSTGKFHAVLAMHHGAVWWWIRDVFKVQDTGNVARLKGSK